MTKEQVRECLKKNVTLAELFPFTETVHNDVIYKADFAPGDEVIYIPDAAVNDLRIHTPKLASEIPEVLDSLYTGNEIIAICGGSEALARYLYSDLNGVHPQSELKALELEGDDQAMIEICGKTWDELFHPWPQMVEITMEETRRVAGTFEVTKEQMEMLKSGINPFAEIMEKDLGNGNGDLEYQFAVCSENGADLVPWCEMEWPDKEEKA